MKLEKEFILSSVTVGLGVHWHASASVPICKPNRYNIVQNVVQFVQYCNLVPIRTICTICTTTFTNIVQKVSQNVVQFIRKGFELIVQHVVQYRKEY